MIRRLLESDFEQVIELGNLITPNFSKTNNLSELLNDRFTKIYVYEDESIIKGFIMYTELDETADILDIIVKEEYRNNGIASNLLDSMLSELNDSVKLITLEVRKSNTPAISLYQKFGFEIVNVRKNYYDNEDAYLMGRRLGE